MSKELKKVTKFLFLLALQVVVLFGIGMAMSFLSSALQLGGFFGDTLKATDINPDSIDPLYDWGARHYWYLWMNVVLFIIALVRIVAWAFDFWDVKPEGI